MLSCIDRELPALLDRAGQIQRSESDRWNDFGAFAVISPLAELFLPELCSLPASKTREFLSDSAAARDSPRVPSIRFGARRPATVRFRRENTHGTAAGLASTGRTGAGSRAERRRSIPNRRGGKCRSAVRRAYWRRI